MEQPTLRQKLKAKGIDSIVDLNPVAFHAPVPQYDIDTDDHTPLPLQDIPQGFTDDDHMVRNSLLPAKPTRFQFLNGLIRSFNLKLAAEDYEHHYPDNYPKTGPKTRVLVVLAQVLRINGQRQVFGGQSGIAVVTLWSKHHQTTLFWYKACMAIRANPLYRASVILMIITVSTFIFTALSPVSAAQVNYHLPAVSATGGSSFSPWGEGRLLSGWRDTINGVTHGI